MSQPHAIQYEILVFAALRDAVGHDTWQLDCDQPLSAARLLAHFFEAYPAVAGLADHTRVAVNQEFLHADRLLAVGDEIALIPPVSGG